MKRDFYKKNNGAIAIAVNPDKKKRNIHVKTFVQQ